MSNAKIGLISLGCAKNQVDLEKLAGKLQQNFEFSDNPAECDLMIVNTCGFIRSAVEEAIDAILSAKQEMPAHGKLIVMGCMSERYADDIGQELPEIDFAAGVAQQDDVVNYINGLYPREAERNDPADIKADDRYLLNPSHYAYLKISEGCDNRCTYCTIPFIRGSHVSVPPEDILREAQALVNNGVQEIIIVSQDSSKYGTDLKDSDTDISVLLQRLASAFPAVYFRIMYLNPDGVTEALLDTVAAHPNIMRYFDIPIQHAADGILRRMNRKSRRIDIERVFTMIREKLPEAFIRTTVIVGFPGETEADFAETEDFLKTMKPDYAGFFPYSPEEGTPAAGLDGAVDEKIVKKRLKILQTIQKNNTVDRLKQMKSSAGRRSKLSGIECFVDKVNDDFTFILEGRAFFQAPEVDGKLYVTDGIPADGAGPYRARIHKIVYPDIYVELIENTRVSD